MKMALHDETSVVTDRSLSKGLHHVRLPVVFSS